MDFVEETKGKGQTCIWYQGRVSGLFFVFLFCFCYVRVFCILVLCKIYYVHISRFFMLTFI